MTPVYSLQDVMPDAERGPLLGATMPVALVLTALFATSATAQPTYESSVLPNGVPEGAEHKNIVEQNPLFYNPAGADGVLGTADDDYRPDKSAGSPLVDMADSAYVTTSTALHGQPKTGSAWDVGAFESHGEALPVELAHFGARIDGAAVRLRWTTASEKNNAGFRVQRQTGDAGLTQPTPGDGTWSTLSFVDGHGTASRPQHYQFVDDDLPAATDQLSYRLLQVDVGGSQQPSRTVVVERSAPNELRLRPAAPNPVQNEALIQLTLPSSAELDHPHLAAYDILGREVARRPLDGYGPGRHELQLDVRRWPSGLYLIRLQAGSETESQRLTVVR